jgi:hypothetical protein
VTVDEACEVLGALVAGARPDGDPDAALDVLKAAVTPELMGAAEACEVLGIPTASRGNLHHLAGRPEPVARLRSGQVWRAPDIRAWAARRAEQQAARAQA